MNSESISFLQACHITKLSTAARMAGLKFKNGAVGYDKAGIIEKLSYHPSIMSATIATIKRMESNSPAVSGGSFLDDLAEETAVNNAIPPIPQSSVSEVIPQEFRNSLDSALRAIGNLQDKTQSIENDYLTRYMGVKIANTQFDNNIKGCFTAIEALKAEVIELKKTTPIQYNFPDKPSIITSAGQHNLYPRLLEYLQINKRCILTGPAGTGKSMAAVTAAKDLGVEFEIQTPFTQSHELIGHKDATGQFHDTPLFRAYTKGRLLLIDEADSCAPDAFLCGNPAFDGNGFCMFGDGKMHRMHKDFYCILNMNTDGNGATMENSGRNRLDGATLARFALRLNWTIDPVIETAMSQGQTRWLAAVRAVRGLIQQRNITDTNATTRHTLAGAMILNSRAANGLNTPESRKDLLEDSLKSGAVAEVWSIVVELPAVKQFIRAV